MVGRRKRVGWAKAALAALEEAAAFIAEDSPIAAKSLVIRVLRLAASLETLSDRGRPVPELSDPAFRELISRPYRIIYRSDADQVTIVTLVHERQNPDSGAILLSCNFRAPNNSMQEAGTSASRRTPAAAGRRLLKTWS